MNHRYRIHLADSVEASDPIQAAERAMEAIKTGHVAFEVHSTNGESTTVEMSGDSALPYFRVVGLDNLFSPRTASFQAEDIYAAKEVAASYGIEQVLHVEETMLTEDTEAEILGWIASKAGNLAGDIKVVTDSAWGNYGTITLLDHLGQLDMHEYTRVGKGQDTGMVESTSRRVLSLCAQKLIELGKTVRVQEAGTGLLAVSCPGAQLFVDRETGEVKGWRAWSVDGLRLAQHVLIVDVLGGELALDDELVVDALNYWTTTGDLVRRGRQLRADSCAPGTA